LSDPRWPDDGPIWPEDDLSEEGGRGPWPAESAASGPFAETPAAEAPSDEATSVEAPPPDAPSVEAGEPSTAFNGSAWNPKLHGERRRPTTAEQAVPWMIGVILALAGIVIVLLALIFTAPDGLLGGSSSPSPSPSGSASAPVATGSGTGSGIAQPSPSAEASTTAEPSIGPSPTPLPEFGALEMVYLGRPSALEPIYLLRRDFAEDAEPSIMAQAGDGIAKFAWAPDGSVGVAIIGERLVALAPGESARALADGVSAVTFGWDSETIYAARISPDGGNDVAEVIQLDFASGDSSTLGEVSYPRPVIGADPALREAQFIDNGGLVRLYAVADGNLALWILGAQATYRVDPGDGSVSELDREPILWSPDGSHRIDVRENANGSTDLILRERSGDSVASVRVTGLVSHVRWVRSNNEIVFTLGRLGGNGGVRQDLYVWDLVDGKAPSPLTSNGVSFGAEWLGVAPNWLP
jgi:hypothetical protein